MKEINVKLIKQNMISSNIYISQSLQKKFELNMECKAKMMTSKNENDKNVLLNIELKLATKDESLKMEVISNMVFALDAFPDDYNEVAEQKLIPLAKENLLNSLDEMLVIMGYSKMELAEKM